METKKPAWEMYNDIGYFDMWAVRDAADRSFNSPRLFHFARHEDAVAFKALAEKSSCAINTASTEASADQSPQVARDSLPLVNQFTGD